MITPVPTLFGSFLKFDSLLNVPTNFSNDFVKNSSNDFFKNSFNDSFKNSYNSSDDTQN